MAARLVLVTLFAVAACGIAHGQQVVDAHLTIDGATLRHEASGVELHGITARLPIALNAGEQGEGTLRVAKVRIGQTDYPGITGRATFVDRVLRAEADWPMLSDAEPMRIAVEFDTGVQPNVGRVTIRQQPVRVTEGGRLAGLHEALASYRITGEVAAALDARFVGQTLDSSATITLADVDFVHRRRDLAIEGIAGTLELASAWPMRSAPQQQITFSRAHSGALGLTDGRITYEVKLPESIAVNEAQWTFDRRGRMALSPFAFDPSAVRIETRVSMEAVEVSDLLTLLAGRRLRGQGQLAGWVSLVFEPTADQPVRLTDGLISAAPGGWVQVRDRQIVADLLDDAGASTGQDVQQMIVDALSDYEYDRLTLQLIREEPGLLLRVQTSGRGRRGERPLEIGSFTANIRGVEEGLELLLRPMRGSRQAIDSALDRLLPHGD